MGMREGNKECATIIYRLIPSICYFEDVISLSITAFVQQQCINHSLLIVDLSGGDKIAPKI
ncbi:hypothetical protein FCV53_02855 [Vibrio sp. F12]|nr:hypothetical protein FCV56_13240 [Vibrio sp. F12]TKE94232.1 hypothetical protein FCV53_02855 [Vibrio sp. F12]TKF00877.1 hypothetical protein FCV61_06475 [Vibrio sp. F12]CDT38016.1 hypothetical protein VCR15J5_580044 [Vibrio crassostreae]